MSSTDHICLKLHPCQLFTLDPAAHVSVAAILAHVHLSISFTINEPTDASHCYSEKTTAITTQNNTTRMHCDFSSFHTTIWVFWLSQSWQTFPVKMSAIGFPDVLPSEDVEARMICHSVLARKSAPGSLQYFRWSCSPLLPVEQEQPWQSVLDYCSCELQLFYPSIFP